MDLLNGLKEQFNWTEQDAALEELRQNTRRGYNPERNGGTINRGLFEGLRDFILQNDPKEIERLAQDEYIKNLKTDLGVGALNSRLKAAGEDEIQITPGTTKGAAKIETADAERKLPVLEGIAAKGGDTSGLSINSSDGQLQEALDTATTNRANSQYYDSPQYQQYLDQLAESDKRFNATQQLAISQMALSEQRAANQMEIAQMNNQLQMRRQESADRRADRKDRQAMIQQLMAGLSAMGASIAI